MSTEPFEPFFLVIPSQYFHCRGNLYSARDNLCIEVGADKSSFMAKGPALLLSGVHVRITNYTKKNRGTFQTEIRIDPWMKFDLDEHRINRDYADIRKELGDNCPYSDNQVCCSTALCEVITREDMSLKFETGRGRLVLLIDDHDYPFVNLSPMQSEWLAIQAPSRQHVSKASKRR